MCLALKVTDSQIGLVIGKVIYNPFKNMSVKQTCFSSKVTGTEVGWPPIPKFRMFDDRTYHVGYKIS